MKKKPLGPMIYGGALVRTLEFRPGVLDALVTVSRRYSHSQFNALVQALDGTIGRTNGAAVVDDAGKTWEPGTLLRIGSNGRDEGRYVALIHKFVPLVTLYPGDALDFLSAGKPLA